MLYILLTCFNQCLYQEKSAILTSVTVLVIASSVNDVISTLRRFKILCFIKANVANELMFGHLY